MSENIAAKVSRIAAPIAKELGLNIWDVRYQKEGASHFLRIFIDSARGVTIEDCEKFSRAIDKPLDTEDFIKDAYFLEVSSPGLNRELRKPEHFEQMKGKDIIIKLYKAQSGQKEFKGVLKDYREKTIFITQDEQACEFNMSDVSKVMLDDLQM